MVRSSAQRSNTRATACGLSFEQSRQPFPWSLGLNALGTTLSPVSSQSVKVGRPSTASCVQPVVSKVNVTCSRPQRNVHRPGFEPGTPWSEIRRTNHCATPPPFNQHQSIYACFVRLNLNQNFLSKY